MITTSTNIDCITQLWLHKIILNPITNIIDSNESAPYTTMPQFINNMTILENKLFHSLLDNKCCKFSFSSPIELSGIYMKTIKSRF